MTVSRSQPSIVERINSRIHDAPMPTEHLLDEAAERIKELERALEPFAECVQDDGTVTENLCPADYRAAYTALQPRRAT